MRMHVDLRNVRIEAASPRDIVKLLKFIKAYYRFDRIPFDRKAVAAGLSLLLYQPEFGRVWLIVFRGKAVGYLILTFGFDLEFGGCQATLTDLYIEALHRRKGIGRRVLKLVDEFCRSRSVMAIELQVTKRNSHALAFYRRAGFRAYDRIPMSKRIGPQPLRA